MRAKAQKEVTRILVQYHPDITVYPNPTEVSEEGGILSFTDEAGVSHVTSMHWEIVY